MIQMIGKTIKDIAEQEGVTVATVRRWAKMAGFELVHGGGVVNLFSDDEVEAVCLHRDRKWKELRNLQASRQS